jgi:peptide/nickel transport system permease protein
MKTMSSPRDAFSPTASTRVTLAWGRLRWSERIALISLGGFTLLAVFAPVFAPYDPQIQVGPSFSAPSLAHPFGTDEIGRDLLSRVIYGIRLTWFPALAIIVFGIVIGTLFGLLSGAYGGAVDRGLQRLTDLFLILPSTLIALAVVAALGPGTVNSVIAVSLFWWPWYSRIVRSDVRAIAVRPHIEAARLAGVTRRRLLGRYLLPGAMPSIVVTATLDVANVILILALFSFLGLGAPAPAPELGAMSARTLSSLTVAWWLPILPAFVIFLIAMAANFAGDGLRNAMRSS